MNNKWRHWNRKSIYFWIWWKGQIETQNNANRILITCNKTCPQHHQSSLPAASWAEPGAWNPESEALWATKLPKGRLRLRWGGVYTRSQSRAGPGTKTPDSQARVSLCTLLCVCTHHTPNTHTHTPHRKCSTNSDTQTPGRMQDSTSSQIHSRRPTPAWIEVCRRPHSAPREHPNIYRNMLTFIHRCSHMYIWSISYEPIISSVMFVYFLFVMGLEGVG